MSYCYEKGLPHSQYLGGEPVWTSADRAKNTAFALEKALQCPRCHTAPWELDDDPHAYQPVVEFCMVCSLREAAHEQNKAQVDKPGYSIVMMPRKVAQRLRATRPVSRVARNRERRARG